MPNHRATPLAPRCNLTVRHFAFSFSPSKSSIPPICSLVFLSSAHMVAKLEHLMTCMCDRYVDAMVMARNKAVNASCAATMAIHSHRISTKACGVLTVPVTMALASVLLSLVLPDRILPRVSFLHPTNSNQKELDLQRGGNRRIFLEHQSRRAEKDVGAYSCDTRARSPVHSDWKFFRTWLLTTHLRVKMRPNSDRPICHLSFHSNTSGLQPKREGANQRERWAFRSLRKGISRLIYTFSGNIG